MTNTIIDELVKKVKAQNRLQLKEIEKEAKARAKTKQKERMDSMKKSDKIFMAKDNAKRNREKFRNERDFMILLRQRGLSIRKIIILIIDKEPTQADYNFVSKVIFKNISNEPYICMTKPAYFVVMRQKNQRKFINQQSRKVKK